MGFQKNAFQFIVILRFVNFLKYVFDVWRVIRVNFTSSSLVEALYESPHSEMSQVEKMIFDINTF